MFLGAILWGALQLCDVRACLFAVIFLGSPDDISNGLRDFKSALLYRWIFDTQFAGEASAHPILSHAIAGTRGGRPVPRAARHCIEHLDETCLPLGNAAVIMASARTGEGARGFLAPIACSALKLRSLTPVCARRSRLCAPLSCIQRPRFTYDSSSNMHSAKVLLHAPPLVRAEPRPSLSRQAVILTDVNAGTVENVWLDELHGLESRPGPTMVMPVSTVKFAQAILFHRSQRRVRAGPGAVFLVPDTRKKRPVAMIGDQRCKSRGCV